MNIRDRAATVIAQTWRYWRTDIGPPKQQPKIVRVLGGGLSNQALLVDYGGSLAVLRLNVSRGIVDSAGDSTEDSTEDTKDSAGGKPGESIEAGVDLGISRPAEYQALRAAHQAGIAPAVLYNSEDVLVTAYLAGEPWQGEEAKRPAAITQIAGLLKRVHALPAIDAELIPSVRAEHYWQIILAGAEAQTNKTELAMSSVLQKLKELRAPMTKVMRVAQAQNYQPCLCHNDLTAGNILCSEGSLYLLDWEYAAVGDPYFDLAAIASDQGYDVCQSEVLLQAYAGHIDATIRQRFDANLAIYRYLELLWYLMCWRQLPALHSDETWRFKIVQLQDQLQELHQKPSL